MKKFLNLVMLISTHFFSNYGITEEPKTYALKSILNFSNKEIKKGKIYSSLEEIILSDQGIFLNTGGYLIDIDAIGYDNDGFFCAWNDDDDDTLWECLKCRTLNSMSRYRCKNCGWDRRN